MIESLEFENNYSTDYNKELSYLPPDINLRCVDIQHTISINEVYNNVNVYIQISRFYDIFMCVKYINNLHITKMTLYCGHFIPICDIQYNDDIYYPINKVTYADTYIKLTFDNSVNIPENLTIIYDTALLHKFYREDHTIQYPLSYCMKNGTIDKPEYLDIFKVFVKPYISHKIYIGEEQVCNYTFENNKVYKILNCYDHEIDIQFGPNIVIHTNLNKIKFIPCVAFFHKVTIVSCNFSEFNLLLQPLYIFEKSYDIGGTTLFIHHGMWFKRNKL
jgi:hypothetical protein